MMITGTGRLTSMFVFSLALSLTMIGAARASDGSQCTICGFMYEKSSKPISELKHDGKADDANMIHVMREACEKAGPGKDECMEIVASHGKALANSFRKGAAKSETCQQIGLCQHMQ